jgi:hypothetical protein
VLLACFTAMAGVAAHVRAEDEILKLVPEEALGFAIVNQPADADAKLQQLGQQMKLPIPSLLAKLQGPGGIRAGFDKNRPIGLLVLPPNDDNSIPAVIALVPVTDYAKFLEQFKPENTKDGVSEIKIWGDASVVRNIGGYAAIAGAPFRDALAEDVKLADKVSAEVAVWRPWLAKKDAAAVMLTPGIRLLSTKVQQGIAAIKPLVAQSGAPQAKQAAAAFDMYVMFFQAVEKEVAAFGLSAERDAQGVVRFTQRARLARGGDWAKFVAGVKPSKQDVLAGLPDGPFVFAGGGPLSESAMGTLLNFSMDLMKNLPDMYGLSEEQVKSLAELGKQRFAGIQGISFLLGTGESGEPIFAKSLGILRVKNSQTLLADYEKYLASYNQLVEKVKSPMFQPISFEKMEFDGARGLKMTMKMPQMPNMPPESVKIMERMYGPGGKIAISMVACDEHTIVFSYMSEEPLRRAIAAIKQGQPGLAGNADVAKVAALLPPDATWVMYFSPKGTFSFVSQTLAAAIPAGNGPKIPEFGPTPPIAMAVTTGPDTVEFHQIVPAEVVKEIGGLIIRTLGPMETEPPLAPGLVPEP